MQNSNDHHRNENNACPECARYTLTEKQLEELSERAATRAVQLIRSQVYQGVGAAVINRAAWIIGAGVIAIGFWAQTKGWLK